MGCTKMSRSMILTGLGCAAMGAAAGSTGAAIFEKAGCLGYSTSQAAKAGATGNAIIGAVIGLGKGLFSSNEKIENKSSLSKILGQTAMTIGLSTAGGMLGKLMLDTIVEMPLDKMAAVMAVGSSSLIAGLSFVLVAGYCLCCCAKTFSDSSSSLPVYNAFPDDSTSAFRP